jgi:MFS family permease
MRFDRRGWLILFALFVSLLFNIGGAMFCIPLFLTPLMKTYGWNHTEVSAIPTVALLLSGLAGPVVGWLLDRIETRNVMAGGAIMVTAGYLFASRTESYWLMVLAFALVGFGIAATAYVPMSVVAARSFGEARGKAIAIAATGSPLGGLTIPITVAYLIEKFGFKSACLALALPDLLVVLPLVLLFVRSRPMPEDAPQSHGAAPQQSEGLPGLELRAALRTNTFWLLASVQLLVSVCLTGTLFNLVPFLIGAGFTPAKAALAESLQAGASFPGALLMGVLADRFSGRKVFSVTAVVMAIGSVLLLGARGGAGWGAIIAFELTFGVVASNTSSVMPVTLVETLGLRSFGMIWGWVNLVCAFGIAGGPLVVGWLVDRTGSYTAGFELCAAMALIGAAATMLVRSPAALESIPAPDMRAVRGH